MTTRSPSFVTADKEERTSVRVLPFFRMTRALTALYHGDTSIEEG
jgi:hypothetical protein